MSRQSIFRTIYFLFFISVTIIAGYLLYLNIAKADPIVGENGDAKILDFGQNIGKKQLFVKIKEKGKGEIIIKKSFSTYCNYELSGFEITAKINPLLQLSENEKIIEVLGSVGIHGENRQYFILRPDLCPFPLAFVKSDQKVYNIFSDQPSFIVKDYNSDGFLDLAPEYRNYNKDPLHDGLRDIYLYDGSKKEFVFERSESYVQ